MRQLHTACTLTAVLCISGVLFAETRDTPPSTRQQKIAEQAKLKAAKSRELQMSKQQAIAARRAARLTKQAPAAPGQPAVAAGDHRVKRQELLLRAQGVAQQLQAQGAIPQLPPNVAQLMPANLGQGGLRQQARQFFPQGVRQEITTVLGQGVNQNWPAIGQGYAQRFGQQFPLGGQGSAPGRAGFAPLNKGLQGGAVGGGRLRAR